MNKYRFRLEGINQIFDMEEEIQDTFVASVKNKEGEEVKVDYDLSEVWEIDDDGERIYSYIIRRHQ